MSGTRWTEEDLRAHQARMSRNKTDPEEFPVFKGLGPQKPSKYRNVKCEVDGILFDSKREAAHWLRLKAREQVGQITNLRRQVSFALRCPVDGSDGISAVVAHYIADFVYQDTRDASTHVVDAKGHRTREYLLKRKWLELQSQVTIDEV